MDEETFNRRCASLLQVVFPPGKPHAERYEFDLDGQELAALGYAIAHWAFMEEALLQATVGIAADLGISEPSGARQDAFRARLRAFSTAAEQIPDEPIRTWFMSLVGRISNENGLRQRLVHGLWSFDMADPDCLLVEKPDEHGGKRLAVNTERIIAFAQRVSEISMKLLNPNGLTIQDIAAEREGSSGYFSRSFLRMIQPDKS
jgi:hypothetical protein